MPETENESRPNDIDSPDFKPRWKSMWAVLVVQAHNVFNDKISQFMLIGLAGVLMGQLTTAGEAVPAALESYKHIGTVLVSLPFVLFAPIAGWLADRFSKRTVLYWCLILQTAVLVWILVCLQNNALWLATAGFFVLAAQSTLLSPAKFGISKELVGSNRMATATGLMQMLVMVSIIIGTVIGGEAFDRLQRNYDDPWKAAWIIILVLLMASAAPFLVMLLVRRTPAQSSEPFRPAILLRHFTYLKELLGDRELRLAAFGVMFFWFAGGMVQLVLILAGLELFPDGKGAMSATTSMWKWVGIGIALGNLTVALVSRKRIELAFVPLGALGMFAGGVLAATTATGGAAFNVGMFVLGFSAGIYLVPLNAFIIDRAAPEKRGRIQSALNLLTSLSGVAAIGFQWIIEVQISWGSAVQFWILAVMSLLVGIYITRLLPRHFLRFIVLGIVRMIYRITPLNTRRVPKEGGVLMISNHVSYVDAFLISAACPRPVRFVIESHFLNFRAFSWFLRMFDVIPISPSRAKEAIRTTADAVKEGSVVCIFPEGMLTRTGMLNQLKKGFELITRQANAPILPVYMDSLWGSIFSFERFRYFYKVPKRLRYPVTVNFGDLIPQEEVEGAHVRAVIQDLSAEAFAERGDLQMSLGEAVVRGLKRRKNRDVLIEIGKRRRELSRAVVLASASSLAGRWRRDWPDDWRRVGILLPAGALTGLINVALVLARRVPVNLPLELVSDAARRDTLLAEHEIRCVISSRALFAGQGDLPEGFLDMSGEIAAINPFSKLGARLAARFEPSFGVVRRLNLRQQELEAEAAAYVTESGRFVSLSHRNVLASVFQIDSSLVFLPGDQILLETTFNHASALFLGLWHPLIQRGQAVYRGLGSRDIPIRAILIDTQPQIVLLDPRLTSELIGPGGGDVSESVKVFLNPREHPLPPSQIELLEAHGAEFCEIFAPDELGAIVSMNTKDPNSMVPSHLPQKGNRKGTVGRLMPGISARIVDSTGGQPQERKLWDEGSLVVRGSSFPAAAEHIELNGETWISTGERGKFDRDGFLTLDGPAKPADEPKTADSDG